MSPESSQGTFDGRLPTKLTVLHAFIFRETRSLLTRDPSASHVTEMPVQASSSGMTNSRYSSSIEPSILWKALRLACEARSFRISSSPDSPSAARSRRRFSIRFERSPYPERDSSTSWEGFRRESQTCIPYLAQVVTVWVQMRDEFPVGSPASERQDRSTSHRPDESVDW